MTSTYKTTGDEMTSTYKTTGDEEKVKTCLKNIFY